MSGENVDYEFVEAIHEAKNTIYDKEYITTGSANATATGPNKKEIATNISIFLSVKQANAVGQMNVGQSKDGYYPLYLSEKQARENSNTNPPSAMEHHIEGTVWYMPFNSESGRYDGNFPVPNFPRLLSQMLTESNDLSSVTSVIKSLGLLETFQNSFTPLDNPTSMILFTIVAPLNSAFNQLYHIQPKLETDDILESLLGHVLVGSTFSNELQHNQILDTLATNIKLKVFRDPDVSGCFLIPFNPNNDSVGPKVKVVFADISATNGVMHILDGCFYIQNGRVDSVIGNGREPVPAPVEPESTGDGGY